MGRMRLDEEFLTPERYFATYVNQVFSRIEDPGFNRTSSTHANTYQHLVDYGASLLGNRARAVEIVDEWLAQRGR